MITRDQAHKLLIEKLPHPGLVKHCMAVEATMRALATRMGHEDEIELWGIAGLLHDMDWESTRSDITAHTKLTCEWIDETNTGDNEALKRLILSHNYTNVAVTEPQNDGEWALYTCDELTGFITACALILPTKKLADVKVSSILKRFPQKAFAAGVHREQIQMCEEKLGIPLEEFVTLTLTAMQTIADDIGM
jgi:putative nucleotidyltransferase with HDIG domain